MTEGENYYSWKVDKLTTANINNKLNLTTDVTNAMMGMLRAMDWDV